MLNKLDILSGITELLLCVAYDVDGERIETWPSSADVLARAKPVYERFPGWSEEIHDVRSLNDLPENARRYVSALEQQAGVPIALISVGPERTQTIERAARPARRGIARPPLGVG
jgi:adenylosuccinate synthase